MHYFPCTPDCPLEVWADWLEDQGIDPTEVRLLAQGWWSLDSLYQHYFMYTSSDFFIAAGNGMGSHFPHGNRPEDGDGFNDIFGYGYGYHFYFNGSGDGFGYECRGDGDRDYRNE